MSDFTVLKEYLSNKKGYVPFFPLVRLKGCAQKMHILKLNNYTRYLYLNPLEGVLISYKAMAKFPHQPNSITNLKDIIHLEFMRESKWYFKQGFYYFLVETADKEQVYYDDNLDVVQFWV
jgi:hypothetical protein